MKARVIVRLKPEVHDPQGETIRRTLFGLGYTRVGELRQGKYFELELDCSTRDEARALAEEIARRVLASPVLETYRVEVDE